MILLIAHSLIGAEIRRIQPGAGQPVLEIAPAPLVRYPGGYNPHRKREFHADCNSPTVWVGDTLYVFNSWERPWRGWGPDLTRLARGAPVQYTDPRLAERWIWFESVWREDDGTMYAFYHNEIPYVCPPREGEKLLPGYPVEVRIGMMRSRDDGATWEDLGHILGTAPGKLKCASESPWFAGGTGDPVAYKDRESGDYYVFFTNYSPEFSEQGIGLARLKWRDRDAPAGKVRIWREGRFSEPGLGGRATPIFPQTVDVFRKDAQGFWGPAIHWNTHLGLYVMTLNRMQDARFAAEGVYISFNRRLSDPRGWSRPVKIMDREEAVRADPDRPHNGWYAQIVGAGKGESDKLAGETARLFLGGISRWEIRFRRAERTR